MLPSKYQLLLNALVQGWTAAAATQPPLCRPICAACCFPLCTLVQGWAAAAATRPPTLPAKSHCMLLPPVYPGAGLGGGSGNAATTLWAANELCGRPASNEELLEVSSHSYFVFF